MKWGQKSYYSLDYYLKETYHEKLYKLSLSGGMTCPNRDGTLGNNGCIFCSAGGSGDFASSPSLSISDQIESAKEKVAQKTSNDSYIAYFQSYTNTYAPVSYLKPLFWSAIHNPSVKILSIATRPDCLTNEILTLLGQLNQVKPVWIELGLQTADDSCADSIRRGYKRTVFEQAVKNLRRLEITIVVHTIIGLPFESPYGILNTIAYLNTMDIQGIKLQLLHVLKGTDLAVLYENNPFWLPSLDEYVSLIGDCISSLRSDIVIHRLTGDGPKQLLIAPMWTGNKRLVLNNIEKHLKAQNIWQGKTYTPKYMKT